MKTRIIRMAITPLLRITDDNDNDLCLSEGKPFIVYSGQSITIAQIAAQLLKEMTPEMMRKLVDQAKIDIPDADPPQA